MKKYKACLFFILVFSFMGSFNSSLFAQEEDSLKFVEKNKNKLFSYINRIIKDTVAEEKSQFMMYPTLAYEPETSLEIGFSPLYVYFANDDKTNRLSEISGFAFVTLNKQYGARFEHAIYSDQDEWFFLGEILAERFPLKYFGIQSEVNRVPEDAIALVDALQINIKERVLRKVANNFFIGFEADFRSLSRVEFKPEENFEDLELPFGADGKTNLGLGVGLVYDNRHNVLNVRDGKFLEFAYLKYNPFMNSSVDYHNFIVDGRYFKPIGKRNVFAAQIFSQTQFGGDIPFNQLSLMGGQSLMRGYFLGRFRDRNQLAAQIEYRMLPLKLGFTNRWGATVFTSAGSVFNNYSNWESDKLKWAAGAGIRFLLFQKKDIWARLDYAYTPDENGLYITIGEAF
ncbi:BamA/TamA family outer membrane protein [Psychroflexus sp. C1]|uniref:BamA/TamA family outer membrane protein n=2 Tax=Psychroflexus maritimus TaxID=2714865 RepID=A0A967AG30_9FLAO|nr:BamA/TamA family outer membrane protein [Psychroflexus maritimus]